MEEILFCFDNDHFSAVDYVDSLYTSFIENNNLNSNSNVMILNKNFTNLLSTLQICSSTLQRDLDSSFNGLSKACSLVGTHPATNDAIEKKLGKIDSIVNVIDEVGDDDDGQITRLQYYVDSLLNLVHTLSDESQSIINSYVEINNTQNDDHLAINTLISLKQINTNLSKVNKQFQTAKFISTISLNTNEESKESASTSNSLFAPTSSIDVVGALDESITITPQVFKNSLEILYDILIEQLNVNKSVVTSAKSLKSIENVGLSNSDLLSKIDSLVELKLFFKNLTFYDKIYLEFIGKIEEAKQDFVAAVKQKEESLQNNIITKTNAAISNQANEKTENLEKETPKKTTETPKDTGAFGGFMNFFNKNL